MRDSGAQKRRLSLRRLESVASKFSAIAVPDEIIPYSMDLKRQEKLISCDLGALTTSKKKKFPPHVALILEWRLLIMGDFEASIVSVVRGFHVYMSLWAPVVGNLNGYMFIIE